MFDIGFGELLLIGLVALVVLGPERLPGAARTLGALVRRARDGWNNVRAEVENELQAEELRNTMRQASERARRAEQVMRETVRGTVDEVRSVADAARRTTAEDASGSADPDAAAKPSAPESPRTEERTHGDG